MPEQENKTSDVFGISRDVPLNYVARDSVDLRFVNDLTRDKHIVVFGSSKQGKTCLRKHCLNSEDYITVHCSNKWQLSDLHAAVLKRAGYELTLSTKRSASGKNRLDAKASAGFAGILKAEAGASEESASGEETEVAELDLDADDVNDIIGALDKIKFSRYIVLEDFHYLPTETQRDFSVALKAFHENSPHCFIIIGVWLEEDRLTVYNGDLTGRVASVSADSWSNAELASVIEVGEPLINVRFDDKFKADLIAACQESVYIVQEACYSVCVAAGVNSTRSETMDLGAGEDVTALIEKVVNQQRGRYNSFLTQFADGFQETELKMYRWLLYPVIKATKEELQSGLRYARIRELLADKHPQGKDLNPGNLTQALQSVAALQIKKDIKPIILDYDQTNLRLRVVDRGFVIWLGHQEKADLLDMIGLPS